MHTHAQTAFVFLATALAASATPQPIDRYVVLLESSGAAEFGPAARALCDFHAGKLVRFDANSLDPLERELRELQPRHVAIVVPPAIIDVEFAHRMLEVSTRIDDDPFCDFAFAFVTGRDGAAAERFVRRGIDAWDRPRSRRAAMFGSWEGLVLPPPIPNTAMKAIGFECEQQFILSRAPQEQRRADARIAYQKMQPFDALLFFSHGYPHEMSLCFTPAELRQWNMPLRASLLVNCACYNGAPARWWMPGPRGFVEQPPVAPGDSVALELLDCGGAAYIAGVDMWHGPLAQQVFCAVAEDGLSIGDAGKQMFDRLALAFAPESVRYPPPSSRGPLQEGRDNRRWNGAAMIIYGDPAFAPFADDAKPLATASIEKADPPRVTITLRPLIDGMPGGDFMLAQARLMDYYSVRTADVMKELKFELYRSVAWPSDKPPQSFRIVSAESDGERIPTGEPQVLLEKAHDGHRLHVRVPIDVGVFDQAWLLRLTRRGASVICEASE
ncbi:MAG: hypothetical protein ACKVS9_00700 [Phycisphaerae bacterium]